jgi:hypothetical protein
MALDLVRLRGMSHSHRRAVPARTGQLLEAAGVAVQEHDDDEQ